MLPQSIIPLEKPISAEEETAIPRKQQNTNQM